MTVIDHETTTTDAFVEKLFTAVLGAQEVQAAYLGDRLGWYDALGDGPLTSTELAERTDTSERYAREWLEHQTVAGWLRCPNPEASHAHRVFEMPEAHRPVLCEREDLSHVLPLARMTAGLGLSL